MKKNAEQTYLSDGEHHPSRYPRGHKFLVAPLVVMLTLSLAACQNDTEETNSQLTGMESGEGVDDVPAGIPDGESDSDINNVTGGDSGPNAGDDDDVDTDTAQGTGLDDDSNTDTESDLDTDSNTDADMPLEDDTDGDNAADGGIDPEDMSSTVFVPSVSDIVDDYGIYVQSGYAEDDVIRIDLITRTTAGTCVEDDQSGCTFDDVLTDIDSRDSFKVDIPVHFKADDFADDGTVNNAELRQRGGGTRIAPQKSFRVKIDDKDTLWRGERHLQLNKHPFDNSRIRNKLSFDLMSGIPNLTSFRTQFVNLWIDDGDGPVDQGLYTHVERGDERYLKRHGLDEDGRLYKAEFFRFRESDRKSLLIDEDGKPLQEDIFEQILEIENGKDHRNLIAMLSALHDPAQSFESVLDRYFNENNVLTWLTVNLLIGQQDATRHNYFLYNPSDSEKFYFLPWDYDFTFIEHKEPPNEYTSDALRERLKFGYAVGSNNELMESFYRQSGAHDRILAAAAELRNSYLDDAGIAERASLLTTTADPYISALPDIDFNEYYSPESSADFASKVAANHEAMINNFSVPLPPTLSEPELSGDSWRFGWKPAHELTGHVLTYDLQIASSPAFMPDDIVFEVTGIEDDVNFVEQAVTAARIGTGVRYARLIARSVNEPQRFWQIADNQLVVGGVRYYGIIQFSAP